MQIKESFSNAGGRAGSIGRERIRGRRNGGKNVPGRGKKTVNWLKRFLTKTRNMKKVADILSHKGSHITSVSPETTVLEALRIMADQNIGSVLVLENEQYKGIMTERDYSRKVILKGKSSTDTKVAEIMTNDLPHVTPHDTIEFCMQLLSDKNIRYLPVFDNGRLCGIVSINDVVKETILTQQETITHLKDYLHSGI
jgi:CBS domain-containing protein